jgi:hypothetical protein
MKNILIMTCRSHHRESLCPKKPSLTGQRRKAKPPLIWLTVKRAINKLEKENHLPPDSVDPEEALSSISLWKSAMIPPDRAGPHASLNLPLGYREFKKFRLLKKWI